MIRGALVELVMEAGRGTGGRAQGTRAGRCKPLAGRRAGGRPTRAAAGVMAPALRVLQGRRRRAARLRVARRTTGDGVPNNQPARERCSQDELVARARRGRGALGQLGTARDARALSEARAGGHRRESFGLDGDHSGP